MIILYFGKKKYIMAQKYFYINIFMWLLFFSYYLFFIMTMCMWKVSLIVTKPWELSCQKLMLMLLMVIGQEDALSHHNKDNYNNQSRMLVTTDFRFGVQVVFGIGEWRPIKGSWSQRKNKTVYRRVLSICQRWGYKIQPNIATKK